MLLAGDVGGTKTNLALYSAETGLEPQHEATFKSSKYPSLKAVIAEFLSDTKATIERVVVGVPGPVVNGESTTTNLPWTIAEDSLREALDLDQVKLLNDLEATGYGVPHLGSDDLHVLNDVEPRSGTKAVVAPGTGLGEAILFFQRGHYHVIPSEGGHTDFAPTNLFQIELLRYLLGKFNHVSYERICSGMGLPFIYQYLNENRYAPELSKVAKALRKVDDPTPVIVENAMSGECELCMATLDTFVAILGAEAGNLALKVMATGGVYLGGGIPPRIVSKLKDGTFMAAFVHKGRFADTLAQIPVYVILNPGTALLGAAAYGLDMQV